MDNYEQQTSAMKSLVSWVFVPVFGLSLSGAVFADEMGSLPTPSSTQLAWHDMEMGALVHFGMNTFTDREWGDGKEDPKLFNPSELNAHQWVSALKAAGIKQLVFTAKHHDGFCLWPSAQTEHSVKNSPWREGKGDVVREVADACRAGGLKLGIYLSPWDRHEPSYGDSPKYNGFFLNQLRELLTNYGLVSEVWFDGACGEGPRGKRQKYDWSAYYKLVRELQPQALIAIAGPDIRWAGNEQGVAHENESSIVPVGADTRKKMLFGDKPSVWWPAECDVSIRPGWFYHKAGDNRVKSLEQLMDIYYKSVGRNAVLQLNVPPDKRGLIHENDVKRLAEFGAEIQRRFGQSVAETSGKGKELTLTLPSLMPVDHVILMEDIRQSERVNEFLVEGLTTNSWQEVSKGQVIGHKRILQFPSTEVSQMRLRSMLYQAVVKRAKIPVENRRGVV